MTDSEINFKAAMTYDVVVKGEEAYRKREDSIGIIRRFLLVFLTKDKKELIDAVADEEFALEAVEIIEAGGKEIEYLENMISLMKSARNRLLLVMSGVYEGKEVQA